MKTTESGGPRGYDAGKKIKGRKRHILTEQHDGATVWEGVVHVFDLKGHPQATRAYAWSSPIEGSDRRGYFAVLHMGAITSPADAVRAAIVAEHRARELGT